MLLNPVVVDISHHNEQVDFFKLSKDSTVGVISKATQGAKYVDPTYATRRGLAKAAGLLWGAYHFCEGSSVNVQLEHFLDVAQPGDKTLVAIDFERNPADAANSMTVTQLIEFADKLTKRLGRRPVIYTGSYLTDLAGQKKIPELSAYRLWWAQYSNQPKIQPSWDDFWLWQYTGDGEGPSPKRKDGVSGDCDISTFAGDNDQLTAQWAA